MSIQLSTADVALLSATMRTLLTPLDFPDAVAWSEQVLNQTTRLLDADSSLAWLPASNAARAFGLSGHFEVAMRNYLEHYATLDTGLLRYREEHHLDVYSAASIRPGYESGAWAELYHDWLRPNQFLDSLGMGFSAPDSTLPYAIHVYHDTDTRRHFGERGELLFQLLMPAFRAGVSTLLNVGGYAATFSRLVDQFDVAVACFDLHGRLVHENQKLRDVLANDPEAERVRQRMHSAALDVARATANRSSKSNHAGIGARATGTTSTARGTYRFSASVSDTSSIAPTPVALVLLEEAVPGSMSDAELRQTFALTPREIDVARQLARGKTNREITAALGISPHTTERHTERVLRKMNVASRAAVGCVVFRRALDDTTPA